MKCTDCGKHIKPVVAMDIDGTIGDYHTHFLKFLEEYYYKDPGRWQYDGSEKFSYWCMKEYDITLEQYRQAKLAYRQGGMKRTMPVYDWAITTCRIIVDLGAELWMTTTRPYLSLDGVVPDTVAWLDHHHIQYDGLLFDADKYAVLASRVERERVVAILDDQVEYLNGAANLFGWDVPILIKTNWNLAQQAVTESSLHGAADLIKDRILAWGDKYGD